jgi:seryl-tRNA synthetase
MREQLRDSSESPSAKYEQLLKEGVSLQKKYETLGKKVGKLYDAGKDDEAEELSEQLNDLSDSFDALMGERVTLLRTIENIETVEDVFPRVKTQTTEDRKKVDYAEVIRAFNAGKMSVEDLKNVAPQNNSEELTDKEFADFCRSRAQLARKLGYKVDEREEENVGNWFDVEKGGIKFSMKHFATRSDYGITGFSRVSKFGVSSIEGEKQSHMWFDRGWDSACTDPKVQKEIDRVLAIFG